MLISKQSVTLSIFVKPQNTQKEQAYSVHF